MKKKVIIIGGGINGLVAGNYLRRHGFNVTILERKNEVGGSVSSTHFTYKGKKYLYPTGATVLGVMQDFIFRETGLSDALSVFSPQHPEIVYCNSHAEPCILYRDVDELKQEMKAKWGEQGKIDQFFSDRD